MAFLDKQNQMVIFMIEANKQPSLLFYVFLYSYIWIGFDFFE